MTKLTQLYLQIKTHLSTLFSNPARPCGSTTSKQPSRDSIRNINRTSHRIGARPCEEKDGVYR